MLDELTKVNLQGSKKWNGIVIDNYSKLKRSSYILPLILVVGIGLWLYVSDALSVGQYAAIQKDCFYFLNAKLAQFPDLIFNLTQLGDAMIVLSICSIFIYYAPKIWETLISASLISCLLASSLKKIFSVPRPAAVFDHTSFVIIGETLTGHNSLPSGHSITVLTMLTVLLFGFMPINLYAKILWSTLLLGFGLLVVLTRVGVGAHYPLDAVTGGIIGYISGLLGIFINQRYPIWKWVNQIRFYPIHFVFILICGVTLITKITVDNLFIFYLALTTLVISLYKLIHVYLKK